MHKIKCLRVQKDKKEVKLLHNMIWVKHFCVNSMVLNMLCFLLPSHSFSVETVNVINSKYKNKQ